MSEYTRNTGSASHTPPPWQLFPHGKIQNADGMGVVAYLATFETEWIANANLIIAAPDLLAVVELLTANHDLELHLDWDNCDCEIATLGRAAIAKARGSV